MKAAPKVIPPISLRQSAMSEANVGGMAAEVEPTSVSWSFGGAEIGVPQNLPQRWGCRPLYGEEGYEAGWNTFLPTV